MTKTEWKGLENHSKSKVSDAETISYRKADKYQIYQML